MPMNNNSDAFDVISTKRWKKWLIITISGRFIIKNLFQIRNVFDKTERDNELFVAIDLSTTTYLDSSAITILLNFHRRCVEKGGKFVVFGLNQDIEEIVSIVGIDKLITIVKTIIDLP
jgi:anti-anti-sigma factor